MREIKFRAWAHASCAMFYPDSDNGWEIVKGQLHALPNTTLMQFTGLLDKNGKEIYEGDVIRDLGGDLHKVEWNAADGGYPYYGSDTSGPVHTHYHGLMTSLNWDSWEVIGNIWENKELLEVK